MSTEPFFIGRMTDPVVAHVLHLSTLDFQVAKFLRTQVKNHTITENDAVVLIADAHLNAKPSALRLLRRSILSANIKIAGVFGEHGKTWAEYMDVPYLTEKPRMNMDHQALDRRHKILQEAIENERQNELTVVCNIVNTAIDQVDQAHELHTQRSALLSFEQKQKSDLAAPAPLQDEGATKSLEDLRLALQKKKGPTEVQSKSPEFERKVVSTTPNVPPKAASQNLEQELNVLISASEATESVRLSEVKENQTAPGHEPLTEAAHISVEQDLELTPLEKRLAAEEDQRFEQRQKESYVIQSSLKVQTPCQSSLGQELPFRQNVVEGRIAVKPLRVRGRIRSGQTLHHEGDVIVEGSVHPSGEVAASGDIHVYGTGGGRLFAGIDGNIHACIYIAVFDAEIVSIAGHYHVIEDSYNNWSGRSIKISLEDGVLNFEEIRLMPQRAA